MLGASAQAQPASSGDGPRLPGVDLVLGVHNQPHFVEACLESLIRWTAEPEWTLFLVDDCSDSYTAARLEWWRDRCDRIRLVRNEANLGFIGTYNRGLKMGSAKYVVMMNSDIVMTDGWLARMVRAAEKDPRIALVNPLTNRATNLTVSMAPGSSAFAMGDDLRKGFPEWTFEILTAVGFCLLIRREALEKHGYLDEAFGRGYGEESDLHMRLVTHGWRAVAAADAYVYHRGEGSFPGAERVAQKAKNLKLFFQRWAAPYESERRLCRMSESMSRVHRQFTVAGRRGFGRLLVDGLRHGCRALVRGHPLQALERFKRRTGATAHRTRYPARDYLERHAGHRRPSVLLVFRHLTDHPDVAHVLEVAHWLNIFGLEARVAAVCPSPPLAVEEVCLEPVRFLGPRDFLAHAPSADVAVAADASVGSLVAELSARQRVRASLVWEPYLQPDEGRPRRAEREGGVQHVPYGVDTRLFYPADARQGARRLLIRTAVRRADLGLARRTVERVRQEAPGVQTLLLVAGGTASRPVHGPWDGMVSIHDRPGWASEYRKGDVLLWLGPRPSTLGLLEGLSSGLTCVYADPEGMTDTVLLRASPVLPVERSDPTALAQRIAPLFQDQDRMLELRRAARLLAVRHDLRETARVWERAIRMAVKSRTAPGPAATT